MSRLMWMGQRGSEMWVPAPVSGMDRSPVGWSAQSTSYINGGAGSRSSFASHREYQPAWSVGSRDALRPIMDMSTGMYGDGLLYFIDPAAADKNVLPMQWSFPAQAALDGPVLFGDVRPSTVPTPSNRNGYPINSATWAQIGGTDPTTSTLYIPIPPGMTLWFGWHGTSNGTGGVVVTPILLGNTSATAVLPAVLDVVDTTRVNTSFDSSIYQGVEISFGSGGGTATSANIAGMMAQILATGATPQQGGFISGQGNSGCRFMGKPTEQVISTALGTDGYISMAAKLVETGDWV